MKITKQFVLLINFRLSLSCHAVGKFEDSFACLFVVRSMLRYNNFVSLSLGLNVKGHMMDNTNENRQVWILICTVYCDVIFLVNPTPGRSDCVLVVSVEVYDYLLDSDFLFWFRLRSRCVTPLPRSRFVSLRLPHINISNIRI